MPTIPTHILDHVVHLTPPGTLQESVAAFRRLGFTVTPGGIHADGRTANALVVFADGTYLELLHFTQPPPENTTHPWGKKLPGWIDFAFLGNDGEPSIAATINARASAERSGAYYEPEVRGGRQREDGRVLEWLISGPEGEGTRGKLPFFCGDLTPRKWRVPLEPRSNFKHENTAQGVAYVKLLVAPEELDVLSKQLTSVIGTAPLTSSEELSWNLGPQPSRSSPATKLPSLLLRAARTEEEHEYVRNRGAGIFELGVRVARARSAVDKTPYGQVVWIE